MKPMQSPPLAGRRGGRRRSSTMNEVPVVGITPIEAAPSPAPRRTSWREGAPLRTHGKQRSGSLPDLFSSGGLAIWQANKLRSAESSTAASSAQLPMGASPSEAIPERSSARQRTSRVSFALRRSSRSSCGEGTPRESCTRLSRASTISSVGSSCNMDELFDDGSVARVDGSVRDQHSASITSTGVPTDVNTVPRLSTVEQERWQQTSWWGWLLLFVFGPVAGQRDQRRGANLLVIHPANRLYLAYDTLLTLGAFMVALLSPLRAAFGLPQLAPAISVAYAAFLFDVALQFFKSSEARGLTVLELSYVASKYLRSWFVLDLLGALPYPVMLRQASSSYVYLSHWLWLLHLPRPIRAMRTLTRETSGTAIRVVWALSVWLLIGEHAVYGDRIPPPFAPRPSWLKKWCCCTGRALIGWCPRARSHDLGCARACASVRVRVLYAVAAHLFACAFFVLGYISRCTVYGETWLDISFPFLNLTRCDATATNGPASDIATILDRSGNVLGTIYIRCLYWALSTTSSLGYGEGPRAHTDAEFLMSIFCQVAGACICALLAADIYACRAALGKCRLARAWHAD